ncbi:MAG: dihydroorotase [Chitinophagaceae bacterium]
MQLLIKQATILNPGSKLHLKKKDILIKNGIIEQIDSNIKIKTKTIDAQGAYLSIGWMDLFAHFGEPGFEHKETLQSGMQLAMQGGYTDVCIMPNTKPCVDNKSQVEAIKKQSGLVNLHPIGAISKKLEGQSLSEMYDMHTGGAIAFSDGKKYVEAAGLFVKALQYVKSFNGLIIQVPDTPTLTQHGSMHEGALSTQLGLQGKPEIAEKIAIQRDIELNQYADSRLHIMGVSTKLGIDEIQKVKKKNPNLTCSVSPMHLLYTDAQLEHYDSTFKINPPLRSEQDRKALIKAIKEKNIDAICSHHTPQDTDAKRVEFEYAQEGVITLQTMLHNLLAVTELEVTDWIELITSNPRKIAKLPIPNIKEKEQACLTLFSIDSQSTFSSTENSSLSSNSPFINQTIQGQILATINNNKVFINE